MPAVDKQCEVPDPFDKWLAETLEEATKCWEGNRRQLHERATMYYMGQRDVLLEVQRKLKELRGA